MTGHRGALLDWYTTLTPQTLAEIGRYYHPQAHFKDPFNEVQGLVAVRAVFEHMFVATQKPRFTIREQLARAAVGRAHGAGDGADAGADAFVDASVDPVHTAVADLAFVTWDFDFGLGGRHYRVQGASRLIFAPDGRVLDHRDYWDVAAELWQKMPLIGGPVAWLRRRFAAG